MESCRERGRNCMTEEIFSFETKEDFEKFRDELDFLRTKRLKELSDELKDARALGDLSENPLYDALMKERSQLYEEILKREEIMKMLITNPVTDILQ